MADPKSELAADREHRMTTADLAQAYDPSPAENDLIRGKEGSEPALLPEHEVADLRNRWNEIQTGFVDEPRRSVEEADALVAAAMQRLAEVFAAERSELEGQWGRGADVSTEDLRIALQRYRSFFGRLLSI